MFFFMIDLLKITCLIVNGANTIQAKTIYKNLKRWEVFQKELQLSQQ